MLGYHNLKKIVDIELIIDFVKKKKFSFIVCKNLKMKGVKLKFSKIATFIKFNFF
jgi:hypothetical protein